MKAPLVADLHALADDMRDLADNTAAVTDTVASPVLAAWIAHTHWIAGQLEKGNTP